MKKIAYLIVCHTDPEMLRELINALNSNSDFYIHVDRKTDIKPFTQLFTDYPNVFFISNRHWVQWGGYGIVAAQISLLENALLKQKEYCRFVHLSGLDYPIVSNKVLYNNFVKEDVEYISGFNISTSDEQTQKDRVEKYHIFRNIQGKANIVHKIIAFLLLKLSSFLPIRKKSTIKINEGEWDVYFGSQFFAITPILADYVLSTVKNNPFLEKYFKTSFAPDEMFIQTIVLNGDINRKIFKNGVDNQCNLHKLASLHYFEYTSEIKVFSDDDLNDFMTSGKFFIRKVSFKKSLSLINKINALRKEED